MLSYVTASEELLPVRVSKIPTAARSPEIIAAFKEPFKRISPAKNILVVKRVSEGNRSY